MSHFVVMRKQTLTNDRLILVERPSETAVAVFDLKQSAIEALVPVHEDHIRRAFHNAMLTDETLRARGVPNVSYSRMQVRQERKNSKERRKADREARSEQWSAKGAAFSKKWEVMGTVGKWLISFLLFALIVSIAAILQLTLVAT